MLLVPLLCGWGLFGRGDAFASGGVVPARLGRRSRAGVTEVAGVTMRSVGQGSSLLALSGG